MAATNAFDAELKKRIAKRLAEARMRLLFQKPFYGNLVLHLQFSLARCGTAGTDMEKILFDPEFVDRLSDEELDFLLMHELLHCALLHPLRKKERNHVIYNIACDIVVNSNILKSMNVTEFFVDGEAVMHLTPDGEEGYLYTAEDVYEKLMKKYEPMMRELQELLQELQQEYGPGIDNHASWDQMRQEELVEARWQENVKNALGAGGGNQGNYPPAIRKLLEDQQRKGKLKWRELLKEFITSSCDKYDFSFVPPDRRFSTGEFILPSFVEDPEEQLEHLWFLIDTSGSISPQMLTDAFYEIVSAVEQFENLSGHLSFFDTRVTDPIDFEAVEDLKDIIPKGGGGTSFYSIFAYMKEHFEDHLPTAVIILTDGFASYPLEEAAMEVPVLWVISEGGEKAPWGTTVMLPKE